MKINSIFIFILSFLILPDFLKSESDDIEMTKKNIPMCLKALELNTFSSLKEHSSNLKSFNRPEIQTEKKIRSNPDNHLTNKNNYRSISLIKQNSLNNILEPQNLTINVNLEDNNKTIIIGNELKDKETGKETLPTISFITDYNDTDSNIFDILDIEEKSLFEIQFKENEESYTDKAQCRLWKPKNENIRMFCRAKFLYGKYTFDEVSFYYKDYNIIIKTEDLFNIKYEPEPINFLYYDKQLINLSEENENYILKFKYDLYIKGGLYIKNENNYILLNDDCQIKEKEKELICNIQRSFIEQNLIRKGNFKLWTFTNYYLGNIMLDSVLEIIIDYDDITQKEDIDITINNPEVNITKAGEIIAFEINTSPNTIIITTDKFNIKFTDINNNENKEYSCYLKKSYNKDSLSLLCLITEEGSFLLSQQELTLNNIHYKYNLHIHKEENSIIFNVTGKGSQIYLTYSNTFNLTLEDSISLKYLMDDPILEENIAISQNNKATENEIIKCNNYNKVKMCNIPISFFEGKENGSFYTYHLLNAEKKDFSPFYESTPFNLILPPNNLIILRIKSEDNSPNIYIGNKGIITFKTNYNDTIKNIITESNITFNSSIIDLEDNIYEVNCTLWKPGNENIRIFCRLNEDLHKEDQRIILKEANFYYKDYNIIVLPETYATVYQRNYSLPFLYSEKQNIELNNGEESYELKFKILSYNNETIYLSSYIILEDCKIVNEELICTILKEKLESNLRSLGLYHLYYLIDGYEYTSFISVLGINIKLPEPIQKEDIYINITKLLTNTNKYTGKITYETNNSLIPEIETNVFSLDFLNKVSLSKEAFTCFFKKNQNDNLLLLCYVNGGNNYQLSKIETEIFLKNIHYKYNFIIETCENNETVNVFDNNLAIHYTYPNDMDFVLNKYFNVIYFVNDKSYIKGLRLNPDLDYFNCTSTYWGIISCKISSDYFNNKLTDYYYTYVQDGNNNWQIIYDANPIYVKLPEKEIILNIKTEYNKKEIKIGINGTFDLVTNYDDIQRNIFNSSDIEELTDFVLNLKDKSGNKDYTISCRLWKPFSEKIRILCKLNEILPSSLEVTLTDIQFDYKTYKILVKSEGSYFLKQINETIPFLYSEPKEINIKEEENSYQLDFDYDKYGEQFLYYNKKNNIDLKQQLNDNRPLYLYKNEMKAIKLKNCGNKDNKLQCNINKGDILEILSFSGENYNLAIKLNSEGLYIFNSVLDIKFNYNITKKEINIKIEKLLTAIVAKNEFIAYETNIENLPSLITDYFIINSEQNQKFNCIFKKSNNQNKVLLLCDANLTGEYSLGKINSYSYDNISIYYKFNIENSENNDKFVISSEGTKISNIYPLELNFIKKDSYNIIYESEFPERLKGIKLNNDSAHELNCESKIWYLECLVDKTHFTMNGNYYTYHINHLGSKTISYEAPLIKVIVEEKNDDDKNLGLIIGLSVAAGVIVIGIIVFIVLHYLRKKNKSNIDVDKKADLLPISSETKE